MKNKLLSQLYESCKKWKTLVLLGAMLLIGMNSAWAATVYYVNVNDWSQVNAYCWDGSGNDGSWPGNKLSKASFQVNGHDVYSCSTSRSSIIFSNKGSNQTGDLAVTDTKIYYYDNWITNSFRTIYVYNSSYSTINLHAWDSNDGDKKYCGNWPGAPISEIGTSNWFKVEIPTGPNKFLINNEGDTRKTGNLTITDYYKEGAAYRSYEFVNESGWKLKEKAYTITLNDNNGGSHNGTSSVAYYGATLYSITDPTRSNYHIEGYYKEVGCSNKIATSTGTLLANTDYTDANGKWTSTSNQTLYAKWEGDSWSITYKDEGNETYSGTNSASLPSTYTYGTGIAELPDGEKDDYIFEGWYDNSSCTGEPVTSIGTSETGNKTFYAKWTELSGGTVTLTAGTGGEVSLDNSSWGSSKAKSGITTNTSFNIYARGSTGYTFSAWAKSSGEGTITSTSSASTSFTPVANKDAELTASFTENMSTLSVSRTIDEGSPSIAAPTVTGSYTNVGYATTRTITAAAAATGYALTGWTITNGTRTDGGGATANPITVRSNGNASETVTVTANYSIQSYTISSTNTDVTYSPASGSSFKFGSTGDKMTITPKSGYKITDIDSDDGAITASADNNAAGSWTVTGTMPGTDVTLTITTASVPEIRIVGRFKIYNSTRTTYTTVNGNTDWETSYSNSHISMTYNYITGFYDLATYRSAAELKGDGNLYFYLCPNGSKKYGSYPNDAVPESSYPASANALDNSGGNFYMNSDEALINVVLHFDVANLKLWFTGDVETLYSTTFYAGDHGSVNANGTSIAKNGNDNVNIGFCRTLTATPESGYAFDRWVTTGSVSVASATSASTTVTATAAGGTVTATYYQLVNSNWYIKGDPAGGDGKWESPTNLPLNRLFPGETYVYYREVTLPANNQYFRFWHDEGGGSKHQYGSNEHDKPVTKGEKYNLKYDNGDSFKYSAGGTLWFVVDASGDTKKCWLQDPQVYSVVTFGYGTGGSSVSAVDGSSNPLISGKAYINGTAITFTQTPADGYDFKEWNTAEDGSGDKLGDDEDGYTIADLDEDVTVYAIYTAHTYTGGVLDKKEGDGENGSYSVTYYTTSFASKTAPTRTGYNVEGYYVETERTNKVANADGSLNANKTYTDGSSRWTYTSSIPTLYTQWQANTHDVSLDMNGSYTSHGTATSTYDATSLSSITPPQRTGYHVEGYYTTAGCATKVADSEGALVASIDGYTGAGGIWTKDADATLYANWAPTSYTVTFNQHGATEAGTASTPVTYDAALPVISVPKKAGYIFGGYFTEEGGSGTQYYKATGAGEKASWDIAGNTILHAKWTGITYHVAFNANGGTGTMEDQDLVYGTPEALTTNTFTRSGYYFLGWNTNADGSGTAYCDGKSVSMLTTTPGAIVTLHAQWAKTQTLYFLNMGTSGWHQGGGVQADAPRYAYAYIYYDGYKWEPLGAFTPTVTQGTAMTPAGSVSLPNCNKETTWCWSISGVPEGATIIFSDNGGSKQTDNLSGWTVEKPYYCYGNNTWYALDEEGGNTISTVTDMSVYIGAGDFGSWQFFALDKHGDETYAIIHLNTDQKSYQYQYYNWRTKTYSGATGDDAYTINGCDTKSDYGGPNGMNGTKDYLVNTKCHASGEYKFLLTWSGETPQTTVRVPRGVNLTTTWPTEAKEGESVTVSFQADAWEDPSSGNDMDNPTYYFEFSTDERNWTTVATATGVSLMRATTSYTFPAQSGYFRVKLVNDNGVASYSGSTAFTAFTTRSFYVYNPWASSGWSTLHLYSWTGSTKYNGDDMPGYDGEHCIHGNAIESIDDDWSYLTIDTRANNFILVGEGGCSDDPNNYECHKTIDCATTGYRPNGKYMLVYRDAKVQLIDYEAQGDKDYRLTYTDASGSRHSDIYNTVLDGSSVTTSMWMNAVNGTSIAIEQGTGSDAWSTVKTYTNSSDGFDELVPAGKRDHGYVFQMTLNMNGASSSIGSGSVQEYVGPFYVRTDGLDGGWNIYKKADHTMNYSAISLTQSTPAFDYSLCKWIDSGSKNVKFTVANDYNRELVASLSGDPNVGDPLYGTEYLPSSTNVRFSYNSQTNTLTRAYLNAATDAASRFLVMIETTDPIGKIYNESGQPLTDGKGKVKDLNEHELLFKDNGNWVYQLVMKAEPGAEAKVTAKYNGEEPDFIENQTLLDGTGGTMYKCLIVYDFKTNILTSAWMADGATIEEAIELNTNVMIIRNGQDEAVQITFDPEEEDASISKAKKLIGVMQFDYDNMVNKMGSWNVQARQYCMYYISFPFDVNVSDIFGAGTYGVDWRLQYYDGAERASKGFFRGDGTTTFWKDVPANGTLSANVGYSLLLNRVKFNNGSSNIWINKTSGSSVYLYFPSTTELTVSDVIKSGDAYVDVPKHECTIERTFEASAGRTVSHAFTDSHWNMMGVPLFESAVSSDGASFIAEDLSGEHDTEPFDEGEGYFYEWSYSTNTFSVRSASDYEFKSMHGYMVQFTGRVNYVGSSIQPAAIAARRMKGERKDYKIDLQLMQDDNRVSRTYVELRDEACDTFALNEDVYMMYTSLPADIYSFAGNYDVSANVMSVNDHIVPVGVEVHNAGTYTFTTPSYFDGTAVLIDTQTGARTNLALEDYSVSLSKGSYNDRFYLELSISKMPTAIDGVEGGSLKDGKAHKFIENGQMYILQNGVIYDAQGKRVK